MGKRIPKIRPTGDSWENIFTGLGDVTRDKRMGGMPVVDFLAYNDLVTLYRSESVASRVVDIPADEQMREGFEVCIPEDEDSSEVIENQLDDLDINTVYTNAIKWKRNFGGSLILIGANDGETDPSIPLDEKHLRSIDYLTVFDCSEAVILSWQGNPAKAGFGEPEFYQIQPRFLGSSAGGFGKPLSKVHASRCIALKGPTAGRSNFGNTGAGFNQNFSFGWGDSVLQRMYTLLRDFGTSTGSITHLMQDFSQGIYQLAGLGDMLVAGQKDAVRQRLLAMDLGKSSMRGIILDGEDKYQRVTTPTAGLSDIMAFQISQICGAAEMPMSMLLGESPSGLNASGDVNVRWFYDRMKRSQNRDIKKGLKYLTHLLLVADTSPLNKEPEKVRIEFPPLYQMDDSQKADIRLKMAQADKIYADMGVLNAIDIQQSRFGDNGYSVDTKIDTSAELAQENHDALMAGEPSLEQQAALAAAPPPAPVAPNSAPPKAKAKGNAKK